MKINTALILCAGLGSRLNPLTLNTPKSLLEIDNITILEKCINTIMNFGIKKSENNWNIYTTCVQRWKEKLFEINTLCMEFD